ncbi:Serine/threonine-protein kinase PrkC [Rubripirellula lacrimiformis]|uniref:Serine/threonine-protein kinase PrkC n=1 Tax=Rubripirellula lacrimiformis TaxID=1930273 RepID=A0A517NA89_9BACT|nr:protein kinase family protein [Rubripirellula lacrimiformis]QDT04055.1 Serine/threonine-protein kinase PrkC [Rubripirellula lacrimiformis]
MLQTSRIMIDVDSLDDDAETTIDQFESNWTADGDFAVQTLLDRHRDEDRLAVLTELIRIDIDLRNENRVPFSLDSYTGLYPELLHHPHRMLAIAFEDFRSRRRCGLEIDVSRWGELPGIEHEPWFRDSFARHVDSVGSSNANLHAVRLDQEVEAGLLEIGFHIVKQIGEGAFSQVFLATQGHLADRYVVLKIYQKSLSEPESMALMQHTNIVPIYSCHQVGAMSVICMPYAGRTTLEDVFRSAFSNSVVRNGENLVSAVRDRVSPAKGQATESDSLLVQAVSESVSPANHSSDQPLGGGSGSVAWGQSHQGRYDDGASLDWAGSGNASARTAPSSPASEEQSVMSPLDQLRSFTSNELTTYLFERLTSALSHAHARGILHGDIKPANVLIRNDGEPALLDFNLSHRVNDERPRHAGGTLPYMAPEDLRSMLGHSPIAEVSSDIYAMGMMMYQFATNRFAFPPPRTAEPKDIEQAIAGRNAEVQWAAGDQVDGGLRLIIEKALAFDPIDRYQSSEQMHRDLLSHSHGLPLVHCREPIRIRARKWLVRYPALTSGAAVGLMFLALLVPLAGTAVVYRQRADHAAITKQIARFQAESNDSLAKMMADPTQRNDETVVSGLDPLIEVGAFSGNAVTDRRLGSLAADAKATFLDGLLRHAVMVGFFESDRLAVQLNDGPLDSEALIRLDQLIRIAEQASTPGNSRATLYLKAQRSRLAGDQKASDRFRSQARKISPKSDTERFLEAVRLMKKENWEEANDIFTALADHGTIPPELRWTSLARAQFSQRDYSAAAISFTQSLERAPESSRLWLLRGLCYLQLSQGERAVEDFTAAIKFNPSNWKALTNRGLVSMNRGNPASAVEDFTEAAKHAPDRGHILLLRSRAYRKLGNTAAADDDLAEVMKSDKLSARSLLSRAQAQMESDPEAALQDLLQAAQFDPNSATVLASTASLLALELHRDEEAIEYLDRLILMQPENERARIDRAVLLSRVGRYDEAITDMNLAIESPNAARTLYQAACVCALQPQKTWHIRGLTYLAQAIQQGYQADHLATDSDLDSLRALPGLQSISRTYWLANRLNNVSPNSQPLLP